MSATTQAIELIDELVKAKIPKQTATRLIDYADKQKGDTAINAIKQNIEAIKQSVSMLKWAVGILAVAVFTLFGLVWQVNEKVNALTIQMKDGFNKIEILIKEK